MNIINLITQKIIRKRSKIVVGRIISYLENSKNILDVGSGPGDVAFLLQKSGKKVTAVDVDDFHGPRLVNTIIYDGEKLPFQNSSFDTALLLMVLNHTPNPDLVFQETSRVANNIIIIETSYTNLVNRFFTIFLDTISNLRLEAFWNSYKTNTDWHFFFKNHGFKVQEFKKFNDKILGFIPFLHILYIIKKE